MVVFNILNLNYVSQVKQMHCVLIDKKYHNNVYNKLSYIKNVNFPHGQFMAKITKSFNKNTINYVYLYILD